jgi:heme-degrading monooxygenase HmoA
LALSGAATIADRPYDRRMTADGEYVIVWRFQVAKRHRDAFERVYGARGPWVALFTTARGYLGSELVRGRRAGDYATVDRWESRAHYDAFRTERQVEYERLDAELSALTESEEPVFEGTSVDA